MHSSVKPFEFIGYLNHYRSGISTEVLATFTYLWSRCISWFWPIYARPAGKLWVWKNFFSWIIFQIPFADRQNRSEFESNIFGRLLSLHPRILPSDDASKICLFGQQIFRHWLEIDFFGECLKVMAKVELKLSNFSAVDLSNCGLHCDSHSIQPAGVFWRSRPCWRRDILKQT